MDRRPALLLTFLLAPSAALNVGGLNRRSMCRNFAAVTTGTALAMLPTCAAFAAADKEAKLVRDTSSQLKALLDGKANFIDTLAAGGEVKLPAAIPFTTFQTLEKTSDPEFMEAAIDYAEAYRGAKDLVKLAKLTKQEVVVSYKEQGKPVEKKTMAYGDAPDSGLATTREYAERSVNELLGASLALDAAIGFMKVGK